MKKKQEPKPKRVVEINATVSRVSATLNIDGRTVTHLYAYDYGDGDCQIFRRQNDFADDHSFTRSEMARFLKAALKMVEKKPCPTT